MMFRGNILLSYAYTYGIPLIYLLLNFKGVLRLSMKQFAVIGLSALSVLLCVLYPTFHGTGDMSYMRTSTYVFRKLVVFLFLYSVLAKKYRDKLSMEYFMKYYAFSQAVYVIVTILFVMIPSIKNAWFTIFDEVIESEEALKSFGYTFRIGWQGFSGYTHTIYCTIACIFLLYLYYGCDSDEKLSSVQFWIAYILSFVGNMFYGRSGLVVTIAASMVAVFICNRHHFTKLLKYIGIIILAVIILINLQRIPFLSDWFYWMSNPIKNLLTKGTFNNVSIQATINDIVFPGMKTFMLGDGYFTVNDRYYMKTDSGLMRNIYFWGIIGTTLVYATTVISMTTLKKKSKALFLIFLVSFATFEYKGIVYCDFLALFLALSFDDNLKNKYANNELPRMLT